MTHKLITIHVKQKDKRKNYLLVYDIYKKFPKLMYLHFFYEPDLIMRISTYDKNRISKFLTARKLKFKVYDYPFPKNKKNFGEGRDSVVYKYFYYFTQLFQLNSTMGIRIKTKDAMPLIERATHTMLNQMGYEWIEEEMILLTLATDACEQLNIMTPIHWAKNYLPNLLPVRLK